MAIVKELSLEEKLKAIIEAQVAGGHEKWEWFVEENHVGLQGGELQRGVHDIYERFGILEILLDTNGAKAAYGEEWIDLKGRGYKMLEWEYNTQRILSAWHTVKGNNYKQAINVAFNLLPK